PLAVTRGEPAYAQHLTSLSVPMERGRLPVPHLVLRRRLDIGIAVVIVQIDGYSWAVLVNVRIDPAVLATDLLARYRPLPPHHTLDPQRTPVDDDGKQSPDGGWLGRLVLVDALDPDGVGTVPLQRLGKLDVLERRDFQDIPWVPTISDGRMDPPVA